MRIRVLPGGAEAEVQTPGATLLDAALEVGLELPFGCQSARCGVCMVEVLAGAGEGLVPPTRLEQAALVAMGAPAGIRLGCQARVRGDVTVRPWTRPPAGTGPGSRAD